MMCDNLDVALSLREREPSGRRGYNIGGLSGNRPENRGATTANVVDGNEAATKGADGVTARREPALGRNAETANPQQSAYSGEDETPRASRRSLKGVGSGT